MLTGKSGDKSSGKPSRQLLFSEALHHSHPPAPARDAQPSTSPTVTDIAEHGTTMDLSLQEITAVGCRLEGMDSAISALASETKSIWLDIAGFQPRFSDRQQCVVTVEDHLNTALDRDRELLFLRSKLVDLEEEES
ncbi:hypothetical protein NDU88_002652 [Pleurodeles waltl]|uniref:Uncharacterized protein n=1 Tax=Pleurodeles waltl TaxID=8319 RepID=A0AAV7T303_PLEWA|nr:hypothetical protein NDU88_002652 [Pleurodeles waltl]